jgi:tetratricopeptide (TPR) repeat protein
VAIVGVALWWPLRYWLPGPLGATTIPAPREAPPVSRVSRADFVGAERCASCHKAEYDAWRVSTHGRAGGAPSANVVIAAFDGRAIRFRDATVTPRVRDGAYEFVVAPDGDEPHVLRVHGVIGGGHMAGGGTQGFVTRWADGTVRFLPFDWSRDGRFWFCNTNSRAGLGWQPITNRLRLADCGDWPPVRVLGDVARWANCQSCHGSQIAVEDSAGQRVTRYASLAINCESCHGPARRHVELAERASGSAAGDIGLASLRTLDKNASLRVCYQCHALKDQLTPGFLAGDSLEAFYSLKLPAQGDRPLHADGRVRTFAYQEGHSFSDCYLSGGMTCTSCHDPHSQRYRTVAEVALTGRFDDAQCTSCHPSKAAQVTAHTHHAAASPGSRCVACHMPFRQQPETADPRVAHENAPVRYTRSDHTIAIPDPRADSALGLVTACAGCHPALGTAALAARINSWWGTLKPASARLAPRNPYAAFDSVARVLDGAGRDGTQGLTSDERTWLERLAGDLDVDVRAAALATLHLAAGDEPAMRRFLARAAAREGRHDFALRSRWALALGTVADRALQGREPGLAVVAYERALDVTPGDPRILLGLGNAQRALGDVEAAVASYRRAVGQANPPALALVNLGITLLARGDSAGGEAALHQAAATDPGEPLAAFNLGNVALRRGRMDAADTLFARAAALDGTLPEAHWQRARIALLRNGDGRTVLRHLLRGLALDSTNAAARELAAQIQRPPR